MMNQYPAKPMMDQMAQYGRYGDSMLVHMNPVEVAGIASLSPTGSLTINPVTGQPEAFLPFLFGALGGAMGLGTIGTAALTGIGTAAVTGDLKRGLISGLTAGFASGLGEGIGSLFDSGADVATDLADAATTGADVATGAADAASAGLDLSNATLAEGFVPPGGTDFLAQAGMPSSGLAGAGGASFPTESAIGQQLATTQGNLAQVGNLPPVDYGAKAQEIIQQSNQAIAPAARAPNMSDAIFGRGEEIAQAGMGKLGGMGQFVAASTGQSMLEQMDVQEDFERAQRAKMEEAEQKRTEAEADLQMGFRMAQPGAPTGRSPMRDRMDRYIRDYGVPGMQAGGQAELDYSKYSEWLASGSDLSFADWLNQGGGSGASTAVTSESLGYLNVDPTEEEAAVLAAARGNTALSPEQQQILEGYYNRYEQQRQDRASQITPESGFDLGAIAAQNPSFFGYNPGVNIGGIDPVTIQAGLRGDYVIRPPDDYMPGFEAEFSYFQDDPYAPVMPYRGYRPTTGGVESEGQYFDPILNRENYKNKLREYYRTLASFQTPGDGDDTVTTPVEPVDDVEETEGDVTVDTVVEPENGDSDTDTTPDESPGSDYYKEHIGWIWTGNPGEAGGEWVKTYRGGVYPSSVPQVLGTDKPTEPPEGYGVAPAGDGNASGNGESDEASVPPGELYQMWLESGSDLSFVQWLSEYLSTASATTPSDGADQSLTDFSQLPENIRNLLSYPFSFPNLTGDYGLAGSGIGYSPPPPPSSPPPPKEPVGPRGPRGRGGPIGGAVRRQEGGTVPLRSSLGQAEVPAGGIAEVDTQFSATPSEDEVAMLADAVLGKSEDQDAIIQMFIEKYGPEMFAAVRDMILKMVVPEAQTSGMIRGNGSGMDDEVPGMIGDQQPVAVSPGEFIVPADVVSGLGDGSSDAGAEELYAMMDRVRRARNGNSKQPPSIDARGSMPA